MRRSDIIMGEELERKAEDLTEYIRSLKLTENEHMEFMKKVTDYKEYLKRHYEEKYKK
jgi:hypothetical protein